MVIAAFEEFCVGKVNVTYERYLFNQHSQEPNERFDVFRGELRQLAKSCKFEAMQDSLIRHLESMNIITPMTEPALLVVTKANGSIRCCLDPKLLNNALQRVPIAMPINSRHIA